MKFLYTKQTAQLLLKVSKYPGFWHHEKKGSDAILLVGPLMISEQMETMKTVSPNWLFRGVTGALVLWPLGKPRGKLQASMRHDLEWVCLHTPNSLPVEGKKGGGYCLAFCFSHVKLVVPATKPVLTCAKRGGVGSV